MYAETKRAIVEAPTPVSIIILFLFLGSFFISLKRVIATESGNELAYFGKSFFTNKAPNHASYHNHTKV